MTVAAVGVQIMWDYTKRGLMLGLYEGKGGDGEERRRGGHGQTDGQGGLEPPAGLVLLCELLHLLLAPLQPTTGK